MKLECSKYILDRIKKLRKLNPQTSEYRFKMEPGVDCFLAEIISVKDSLLQEINDRLVLGLPPDKVNNSSVNKALKDVKKFSKKQRADLLQDILDMEQKNWLWRLNQYRNMSIHRSPLNFMPISTLSKVEGIKFKEIRLQPITGDPVPLEREVIHYSSESLRHMEELIKSIEEKLDLLTS